MTIQEKPSKPYERTSGFIRKILILLKRIFDLIRPVVNLYNVAIFLYPNKNKAGILRKMGSVIFSNAAVTGKVSIYEPLWLQIGENTSIHHLESSGPYFIYVSENKSLSHITAKENLIIGGANSFYGHDTSRKRVTISLDLEGAVAPKEWGRPRNRHDNLHIQDAVLKLAGLFQKYEIPTTWAICGHLFLSNCNGCHDFGDGGGEGNGIEGDPGTNELLNPNWYLKSFIETHIIPDPLIEIGYHGFMHMRYTDLTRQMALKDLEYADKIRREFNLKLETLVFPGNLPGFFEEAVERGFKNFRGTVGQHYMPMTVDFKKFKLFGTSMCFWPGNIKQVSKETSQAVGKNFNYFTHPESWIGADLADFEKFLANLALLRDKNAICISKICES